jgi:hypothetical protein
MLFGRARLIMPLALLLAVGAGGIVAGADVKTLLAHIKAVGKKGEGNVAAAKAWRELAKSGPDALIDVLTALDDATPTAANWLRSAVEAIVDRSLRASRPLPGAKLEAFVKDTRHAGPARRLAFDCLARVDRTAPGRLLPGMLHDPGAELRRDAVALVIKEAEALAGKKDRAAAVAAYRKALAAARDRDQVERIARALKPLGIAVDLTKQFGFLTTWQLIGPFDNGGGVGFGKAFPPEKAVDLTAKCEGKKGKQTGWVEHTTALPYGLVDLNKALGKNMGAAAYAFAAVHSARERPVEIRVGSNNAVKIFLNGKEIYFRDEYHHGMRMDQHVGRGVLKAGRNEILVKVCQNEQKDDWAQLWSFQARVCDALGGPVPLTRIADKAERITGGRK